MKALIASVALAALLLAPFPTSAQSDSDRHVADAVARSVTTYARFTIFDDVSVHVRDGTATLMGKVTMPIKRDEIGRRVAALPGVRTVRNEIAVLPVSIQDDALRKKIARAIYGHPSFWRFAAMPNPPIHIIVEHGRVTLTGVVPSDVDRLLARSLATGQGELSVTSELRIDARS